MEEKETKETEVNPKSLGYKMGELFGATCILAAMILIAALTAKLVFWMF